MLPHLIAAFGGQDMEPSSAPESAAYTEESKMVGDAQPKGVCGIVARNPGTTETLSSDEFLLERLQDGDHGALALLFRRYARMVRAIAHRIVSDKAEADDVLQEVFLFVFRKCALFDAARGSARSWIAQVTYHRAIDHRRHLASRNFYSNLEFRETGLTNDEPMIDSAFYERSIEGILGMELLDRIEESLSCEQKKTIQLYFFGGYSFEEIAELTGQSVGNIRNHHYRGLERIRNLVFAQKLGDI